MPGNAQPGGRGDQTRASVPAPLACARLPRPWPPVAPRRRPRAGRRPCRRDRDNDVHHADPVEVESYRILRSRLDLSMLPPLSRAVTERVIYATADFDYVTDLVCDEAALAVGLGALRRGAPVVADASTVEAGITGYPVICKAGDSLAARL